MNLQLAFELVNNLDVREPLRKLSPQWSLLSIDKNGDIVGIARMKFAPQTSEQLAEFKKYPDTVQITAWPGRFCEIGDLEKAVKESVWVHKHY